MLAFAFLVIQPHHRFVREPPERLDSQLQIFSLRVFCLIVTKPCKRLSKHHRSRNSGTRNLRRIVQRPRRKFVSCARSLANRPLHKTQSIADRTRSARCSISSTTRQCKRSSAANRSLASRASISIEARTPGSRSRISKVVSHRPTTAVTIPGKVFTLPIVATAIRMLPRNWANLKRKLSQQAAKRISPHSHRRRSGVRLLPIKSNRMALHPFRAKHHAKRAAPDSPEPAPCSICSSR